MNLVIRENIVILTSERWSDRTNLADAIKTAFGDRKCTVVHFAELKHQIISSLGEKYSEARVLARVSESIARSISAALMCDSALVLDTDITSIHEFRALVRMIEYVYEQVTQWFKEQKGLLPAKDKERKIIEKRLEAGPPKILHVKVMNDTSREEQNIAQFFADVSDELYFAMGDEGRDIAEILRDNDIIRTEHSRVEYAGLLYYENRTSYLEFTEEKVFNENDVLVTIDL